MKLFICPKLDCDRDGDRDDKCYHLVNHLHKPNCDQHFGFCPSCVEIIDFIEPEEMEIDIS